MTTYIALLRGINVGGNNKVAMSKLKTCFESLGYEHVSTYINSGNVIFESNAKNTSLLAQTIEKKLKETFGFDIRTIVRDSKNIQTVAKKIPASWTNDTKQKSDVLFLWDAYENKASIKLLPLTSGIDSAIYVPGAILWNVNRDNYAKSGMHKFIGTIVYKHMTARNVNTVRKLAELVNARK